MIASTSTFPDLTHRLLFHLGQKLLNTTFWLPSFRAAIPLWYTWYTFCIIILSQYRNFYFHISAIFFKWLLGHSEFMTDISGFRRGTRSDSKKDCCEVGGEVQWDVYEKVRLYKDFLRSWQTRSRLWSFTRSAPLRQEAIKSSSLGTLSMNCIVM